MNFLSDSQLIAPALSNCQLLTTELKVFKVGTLNVEGCWKEDKQQFIYKDALKYDQQILGLTETHVVQEDILTITARYQTKQRRYKVYHGEIQRTNQYTGTGFLIEEFLNPHFKRISDRISTTKIQLNDDQYATIIVAYAPTIRKSKQNPASEKNFATSKIVLHLNTKTTSTFFWSSVMLMRRQVIHTPDSLKAWKNLERGLETAMVNIFLSAPWKKS